MNFYKNEIFTNCLIILIGLLLAALPVIIIMDITVPVSVISIIAIQEISKGYQQQKTNLRSPKDESARKPQQYLAEAESPEKIV